MIHVRRFAIGAATVATLYLLVMFFGWLDSLEWGSAGSYVVAGVICGIALYGIGALMDGAMKSE